MQSQVAEQLVKVVQRLVDHPEAVLIEEQERGRTVLLRLTVAPEELGRVIGRQGRTVRALRTLLETRETQTGREYDLEIVEPAAAGPGSPEVE